MKNLLLPFAVLCLSHVMVAQTCLPSGITFSTQAQIDNFTSTYPGCSQILGNVSISGGSSITNLNGLSVLTFIGGRLEIKNNTALTSLNGLNNLDTVAHHFEIINNDALTNLTGLENLGGIGYYLHISDNAAITSLNGLSGLTKVGFWVSIDNNTNLSSITALSNLASVGKSPLNIPSMPRNFGIASNPALASLNGLGSLVNFGGSLFIDLNASLTNLDGLGSISKIGTNNTHQLRINGNASLAHINALSNLDSVPGNVVITGNPMLGGLSGLSDLEFIGSGLFVMNNAALVNLSGLNNITAVPGILNIFNNDAMTTLTGLHNLVSIGGNFELSGNGGLQNLTALNSLTSVGGYTKLTNNDLLTNFNGLNNLASFGGYVQIDYNDALTSLTGLNLGSITASLYISYNTILPNLTGMTSPVSLNFDLQIDNNAALTSLSGLNSLTSVRTLSVLDNASLANLSGLNNLATINDNLYIGNNPALTSLAALGNLTFVDDVLSITNNDMLTSLSGLDNISPTSFSNLFLLNSSLLSVCEVPSICNYLANPSNPASINANTTGCNSRCQVENECGVYSMPNCTSMSFPANNAMNVPVDVWVNWSPVALGCLTGYRLDIGTTPGGTEILNNFDAGNTTFYSPSSNYPYNTTIYVKIKPYNGSNMNTSCEIKNFTTQAPPPPCTNLSSPVNGAISVPVTASLDWTAAATATGYRLDVGTTPSGMDLLNNFDAGNVLTHNPPGDFPFNTTIYVKIKPYNASGSAVGCPEESFTTTCQLLTFYQDNDNDTYGNAAMTTQACSAPNGYVANSTDCNDNNAAIYPGAAEVCNGVDDDCSGSPEAAANTWSGNGDGTNWTNSANWSDGIVPLSCQDVILSAGSNVQVGAGETAIGKTLDVPASAQLQVSLTGVLDIEN